MEALKSKIRKWVKASGVPLTSTEQTQLANELQDTIVSWLKAPPSKRESLLRYRKHQIVLRFSDRPYVSPGHGGLTKTQLVRYLASRVATNNKTALSFLDHLAETAIKETKKHGAFVVPGIGTLAHSYSKAKMGRNPKNAPATNTKVVHFKVAKAIRDVVTRGKD
jgi:DNA-binding protein HU-beta